MFAVGLAVISAALLAQSPQPASSPAGQPVQAPPAAAAPAPAQPAAPLPHVEVRGNGPVPIVLIPGLNCDWSVFDTFMTRNAANYTMYAVRLPGFGGSEAPKTPEGSTFRDGAWLDGAERSIVAMIKDKKLDKPVVMGHSMGGHLALRIGAHNPDLLRSVIDIDGFPTVPFAGDAPPPLETRIKQAEVMSAKIPPEDGAYAAYMLQFATSMVTDPHRAEELSTMMAAVPRPVMVRYFSEMMMADPSAELRAMKPKALVIAAIPPGAKLMRETTRSSWEKMAGVIGNSTVAYFEDTHHFVMDDSPKELDAAVAAFIEGKPVPGKPWSGEKPKPPAKGAAGKP